MTRAYLTMDDGASQDTTRYMKFLQEKNIRPIMFFWGQRLNATYEQGIQALRMGAVVGNHSYSHPHFSKLSPEECAEEINKQEKLLDKLYKDAGIERKYKLFRFPYGDKGGENAHGIQQLLKSQGFSRLNDGDISYPWYREQGLHRDMDVLWTFNLQEYRLQHEDGITMDDILRSMKDPHPSKGGSLQDADSLQIILIHDHPETDKKCPGYFTTLIQHLLDTGVQFIEPAFES